MKETKITQKKGTMTKAPTSSAAGVMKTRAGTGGEKRETLHREPPRAARQSLLTVFSSPTISMTAALYWAIASSGLSSPETTASVIRWIATDTSL